MYCLLAVENELARYQKNTNKLKIESISMKSSFDEFESNSFDYKKAWPASQALLRFCNHVSAIIIYTKYHSYIREAARSFVRRDST